MIKPGDTLHVKSDGKSYMTVAVTEVRDGQVWGDVTWAVILALRYRCFVADIEQRGNQWVCDHGMSARANLNADRNARPLPLFTALAQEGGR